MTSLTKLGSIPEIPMSPDKASDGEPSIELMHEATSKYTLSGNTGWYNLIKIIATLSILRHLVLNLIEFGIIMEFPLSKVNISDSLYFCYILALNSLRCAIAYFICVYNRLLFIPYLIVTETLLASLIFFKIKYTYLSALAYTITILTDFKLVSFYLLGLGATVKQFVFFLIVPALVFKSRYSRKTIIDYRLIARRSVQFLVYFILFVFLMDQYAIPSIYKIIRPTSYFSFIENSINVSLSSILLFFLFFQLVFNCFLAIASELTGFNEPLYDEWWNSSTAGEFWTRWNIPVHLFIKTHIYIPLLRKGININITKAVCFIFSGIIHEAVISMAIKKVTGWMFLAMILQIPLISISDALIKRFPTFGNIFFWFSFCVIGQPIIALLFFRSLYIEQVKNVIL